MEPRVCPNCGAKSASDRVTCTDCGALLDAEREIGLVSGPASIPDPPPAAPPTAAASGEPAQPAPAQQVQRSEQPPPSPRSPYGPPHAHPVPGSYASPHTASAGAQPQPRPAYQRPARNEEGVNWRAVVLVVLFLSCATFAAWWFLLRDPSPADTVNAFMSACATGDVEVAKSCFTRATLALLGPSSDRAFASAVAQLRGDTHTRVLGTQYEGSDGEIAVVQVEPDNAPAGLQIRLDIVLLREDGEWKIDVPGTARRVRSGAGIARGGS